MQRIYLESDQVIEYISGNIDDFIQDCVVVNDAKYHHNTDYTSAVSILKNNILSLEDLSKIKAKRFSEEFLKVMSDHESHANGSDGISLAVVGLKDINEDEIEYDPFSTHHIDFVIGSDIKACRSSVNYGNEYISFEQIPAEKIKAVDIRIAKYIDMLLSKKEIDEESIKTLIQRYNCIRNIAISLRQEGLNIPLREMSYNNCSSLDIDMVASSPKLVLKS